MAVTFLGCLYVGHFSRLFIWRSFSWLFTWRTFSRLFIWRSFSWLFTHGVHFSQLFIWRSFFSATYMAVTFSRLYSWRSFYMCIIYRLFYMNIYMVDGSHFLGHLYSDNLQHDSSPSLIRTTSNNCQLVFCESEMIYRFEIKIIKSRFIQHIPKLFRLLIHN